MPSSSFAADPSGAPQPPHPTTSGAAPVVSNSVAPYTVASSSTSGESQDRNTVMFPPPVYGPYDGTAFPSGPGPGMVYGYPPNPPAGYPPNYPPYNAGRGWPVYDASSYNNYPSQRPRDMNTTSARTNESKGDTKMDDSQSSKGLEAEMEEVAPIQTDFHFFVLQWKDQLLHEAEKEVDESLRDYDDDYKFKYRLHLVNSNLNCRLMKKWEDFTMEEREDFFQKEEDDRRRFMTEDEVISRHCFTLTARVRSPTKKNSDDEYGGEKRPYPESSPTTEDETSPKKNRVEC